MKHLLFTLALLLSLTIGSNAQSMSCFELTNIIKYKGGSLVSSHYGLDSEFITSVNFYRYDGNYYVIVGLNYSEYVYASSYEHMTRFKEYVYTDQVGEAFHVYIKPHKLDCW